MKNNVADVRKMDKIKKKIYSFDKKGKRKEEVVEVNDMYMVTLRNGDQVALTEKQLKFYGIIYSKETKKSEEVQQNIVNIDDDDDDLELNNDNDENNSANFLPLITTTEQVVSSSAN